MKNALSLCLAALLALFCAGCGGQSASSDEVVAVVLDQNITLRQAETALVSFVSGYGMTLEDIRADETIFEKLKTDFLNKMVLEHLISREAAALGCAFDASGEAAFEAEYEAFLTQLDENNRREALVEAELSPSAVDAALPELREWYFAAFGYTADGFRAHSRRQFITEQVRETVLQDAPPGMSAEQQAEYWQTVCAQVLAQAVASGDAVLYPDRFTI